MQLNTKKYVQKFSGCQNFRHTVREVWGRCGEVKRGVGK